MRLLKIIVNTLAITLIPFAFTVALASVLVANARKMDNNIIKRLLKGDFFFWEKLTK